MKKNRQSHRLQGYNYSQNGAYFITIVCQDRKHRFGEIVDGLMVLNDAGRMVQAVWNDIPNRFPMVQLGAFVIMPNHIHGIVVINDTAGARPRVRPKMNDDDGFDNDGFDDTTNDQLNCQLNDQFDNRTDTRPAPAGDIIERKTIGDIVCAFKSITTYRYTNGVKLKLVPPFRKRLWQRDYHDHIIRNESQYQGISRYIINNPRSWKEDCLTQSKSELRENRAEYRAEYRDENGSEHGSEQEDAWRFIC